MFEVTTESLYWGHQSKINQYQGPPFLARQLGIPTRGDCGASYLYKLFHARDLSPAKGRQDEREARG